MTVIGMVRIFRNWRVCILTAMILVSPPPTIGFAQEQNSVTSTADALHAALVDRHSSMFANGAPDPLFDFYASRNFAPAWTGPRNDANLATAVLSALSHADTQGLRAEDYSNTATKWSAPPDAGPDAAAFEMSLTTDLMRYAADVRLGKLNPAQVYQDVDLPARTFEFVAALNSALRTGSIDRFLADLPPQQPQYQGLIQA